MAEDYKEEAQKYRIWYEAAVELLHDKDDEIANLKAELVILRKNVCEVNGDISV